MKTCWSAFILSLLMTLVGCGSEQFGIAPKTEKSTADTLKSFEQTSCANMTLIKPKVDILYVVDNSQSTVYLPSDIQSAIRSTVDSISQQFDFRVIGTKLISPNTIDYQVLTNSTDLSGVPADSRRINDSGEFTFFIDTATGAEQGLARTYQFINANRTLFRTGSNLIVILISNGRDTDVETAQFSNGQTTQNASVYASRRSDLIDASNPNSVKSILRPQQFRFFSITAQTNTCNGQSGWLTSQKSYVQMSKDVYLNSLATDSTSNDNYDLCGGFNSLYAGVNNSIKQAVIAHSYRYWPITFAEDNDLVSLTDIQVFKVSNGASTLMPSSSWTYYLNPNYPSAPVLTRESPTPGEPISGKNFIKFVGPALTYPDCVSIRSITKTEYFGFISLPSKPKLDGTFHININGREIPKSDTDGWSYLGDTALTKNIKVMHPDDPNSSLTPPVMKTGFMIQLNGKNNYYKSGDSVKVDYLPSGV